MNSIITDVQILNYLRDEIFYLVPIFVANRLIKNKNNVYFFQALNWNRLIFVYVNYFINEIV